jgi:hypothetical protein
MKKHEKRILDALAKGWRLYGCTAPWDYRYRLYRPGQTHPMTANFFAIRRLHSGNYLKAAGRPVLETLLPFRPVKKPCDAFWWQEYEAR